ncbi:LOW QUALITY PROTEIN: uncharacterized protein QC763_209230 [Podospora pseudopauciseta]|uniref:GH18 domain-containing protein n=1 Tax=Podospora pseudopauciseta TaxID=2093780 RepID=A0ABR0HPZ4_9PEZI|nr:LOW QUALITY PROTEIN: hypothetical protein QC763_209230 [Podospora pseudopauciseta]
MTYDLHGQWDFDSHWSSPGCPAGNCLRSHINRTETLNALSMVTKTGVSSTKLIIGITSYGRSFRMVDPSCTGPMCTFTGALSGAKPGRCARTTGYLANAEIQEILHYDKSSRTYYDEGIMSDILVYGSDWVADMNNYNKGRREALWKSMNFGGVSDWAIGLAEFLPNDVSQVPSLSMEEIKEDWANITCKHPYARNSSYRVSDRWKTLKVDEAWTHVVVKWDACAKSGMPFPVFVSRLLNDPDGMYCGSISSTNNCLATVECSDESERRPAAALLLSSFVKLAGIYYELYDGIQAAQVNLITTLSKFSSTFAPEQKADKSLTMTLNILSAGFGVLAGPVFAKAFSSGNFFSQNPGIGEKLESAVMKGVELGLAEAKEYAKKKNPCLVLFPMSFYPTHQTDLASQFNWIVMSWKEIVDITQRQAFSETKDGVSYLSSMMSNGKLLKVEPMNRFDTESAMVKVLYAFLIPHVWHLRAYSPVLIHAEWDCQKVGVDKFIWLQSGDKDVAKMCIDNPSALLSLPWRSNDDRPQLGQLVWRFGAESNAGLARHRDSRVSIDGWAKRSHVGINHADRHCKKRHAKWGNKGFDKLLDLFNGEHLNNLIEEVTNGDVKLLPGIMNILMCDPQTVFDN